MSNSWQVVYARSGSSRDSILQTYLEASGLEIFRAKNPTEFRVLMQERDINTLILSAWFLKELKGEDYKSFQDFSREYKSSNLIYVSEENDMDHFFSNNIKSLILPKNLFNTVTLGRKVVLTPSHLEYLQKQLSQLLALDIMSSGESSSEKSERLESFLQSNKKQHEQRELSIIDDDPLYSSRVVLQSKKILEVYEKALLVADTEANVIIHGPSGVGKELVAEVIQKNSRRSKKNFIKVNCAAISPSIIESEFFGHEKGAFTGAFNTRKGIFEAADKGTLFLDEISELDLPMQTKLLRAIEYGEIIRVGSMQVIKVDVRIIAATNRDLRQQVREKSFREDLFYRLNVINIYVPPLKDRPEDIPSLFNYFVDMFNQKYNRDIHQIDNDAKRILIGYSWPGNVRELRNVIEQMIILKKDDTIRLNDLPVEIAEKGIPKLSWRNNNGDKVPYVEPGISLESYEKEIIRKNLEYFGGSRRDCAVHLGISERTLYRKIKEYDLEEK